MLFPTEIDGRRFLGIKSYYIAPMALVPDNFGGEILKKIFFQENTDIDVLSPSLSSLYKRKLIAAFCFDDCTKIDFETLYNFQAAAYYSSHKNYQYKIDEYKIKSLGYLFYPKFKPANVSYYWNYENAPDSGYYWIDDYNGELISYIPEDPKREGYEFTGLYKESECIDKWDFESDIVPYKGYFDFRDLNNADNYVYFDFHAAYIDDPSFFIETILYAGWKEI